VVSEEQDYYPPTPEPASPLSHGHGLHGNSCIVWVPGNVTYSSHLLPDQDVVSEESVEKVLKPLSQNPLYSKRKNPGSQLSTKDNGRPSSSSDHSGDKQVQVHHNSGDDPSRNPQDNGRPSSSSDHSGDKQVQVPQMPGSDPSRNPQDPSEDNDGPPSSSEESGDADIEENDGPPSSSEESGDADIEDEAPKWKCIVPDREGRLRIHGPFSTRYMLQSYQKGKLNDNWLLSYRLCISGTNPFSEFSSLCNLFPEVRDAFTVPPQVWKIELEGGVVTKSKYSENQIQSLLRDGQLEENSRLSHGDADNPETFHRLKDSTPWMHGREVQSKAETRRWILATLVKYLCPCRSWRVDYFASCALWGHKSDRFTFFCTVPVGCQ